MTNPTPDHAEAWATELHLAALINTRTHTINKRPLTDYRLIAHIAHHGPRTPQEAQHILADPHLQHLLQDEWADPRPTPQLRQQLAKDPCGRGLLSLAPNAAATSTVGASVISGPLGPSWRERLARFVVPAPLAHAAAADESLGLVFTHEATGLGLIVEGRGDIDEFVLVVTDAHDEGGLVAVWLDTENDQPTLLLPLLADDEGRRSASAWCDYPTEGAVTRVSRADLDDPGVLEAVTRGVQAADGFTLDAWQRLAREAGPGSALHAAVVKGLR